ncbi:MAG: hypothetical protein ACI9JD_000007 [Rhodococcus sp. (in: high G+C Gram-positive bacteria)]|jgi:hypothetical protein
MLSIHERSFSPEGRSQAGHWKGDLIIGNHHGSAIGTLVERQARMVRLLQLPRSPASHSTGHANARSSAEPAAGDHLGPRHRNGPPCRHHRSSGAARVLLRFPITMATRLQRERQWPTARLLFHRRQPHTPPECTYWQAKTTAITGPAWFPKTVARQIYSLVCKAHRIRRCCDVD